MGRSGAEGDSEVRSILYLASPRGHFSRVINIVGELIYNLRVKDLGFTQILSAGTVIVFDTAIGYNISSITTNE